MLRVTTDFEEVNDEIDHRARAVVYFTAEWCGPCRQLKPQYARASVLDADTSYFLIDVDKITEPEYLNTFGVQTIPFVFYITDEGWTPIASRTAQGIVDEVNKVAA